MTMTVNAALNRYKNVQVKTSSPGELLVMLYDGLFRFLGEAKTAMESGERARAAERISRSHQILQQLNNGLNREHAPDLCDNLHRLYLFAMGHIVQANIQQKPENIAEVLRVLTPLREAWTTVVRGEGAKNENQNVSITTIASPTISIR
ncbi:MAG: flagellar export chaperone FliS [Polyangiaceae bacterium]